LDIAAQVLVPQFILAILEFIRTLILVPGFRIQATQQSLMEMAQLTVMVTELTSLQLRQALHMESQRMQLWFR
jgi:BioD-like phosphotransacetylase family protein